jgi:protein LTV1
LTSREDFDAMLDDFLDNYEILGRRMKPVLHGATPADKLAAYRLALVEGAPVRVRDGDDDGDDGEMLMPMDIDAPKDRWDCETILSG